MVLSIQHMYPDYILSSLQDKILRIVCTTRDATYSTLIQETKRDRTTVLQSVESLIKHGFIEKQKVNPEYEKSKLIFKATPTGKQIAWEYLQMDLEDIMKLEDDPLIANYLEFIKDISDPVQRKALLLPLSDLLKSPRAWISESRIADNEEIRGIRREIIRDSFKESLLELVQNKNYEAKDLFNAERIKWFTKIFTSKEIKEIREYIRLVAYKANLTIEKFPD